MILYYGVTTYHILCCLLHRITFNSEESNAVLYVSGLNNYANSIKTNLEKLDLFSEIIIFDDSFCLRNNLREYNRNSVRQIVANVEQALEHDLNNITEFNICGDHFPLGIYIINKKIQYNFFEEASGILSRPEILINNVKNTNELQYRTSIDMNAYGRNDLVKNKFANLSAQKDGFRDERTIDFNVNRILDELNHLDLMKVKMAFGFKETETSRVEGKTALLLTQHFSNLDTMTIEEQENLYSLLVDYYIGDDYEIYIKPHPSDVQGVYKQIFPNAHHIPRQFPSELLTYYIGHEFDLGVTLSSTAFYNLNNLIKDTITFSQKTEKEFRNVHRYYATSLLLELIKSESSSYYSLGIDDLLLDSFLKNNSRLVNCKFLSIPSIEKIEEDKNTRVVVIDKPEVMGLHVAANVAKWLYSLRESDVVVFINSEENNIFYDFGYEAIFNNMVEMRIEVNNMESALYSSKKEKSSVFVYSKDETLLKAIENIRIEKNMSYSKLDLVIKASESIKDQVEDKVKRGILKATLKRLEMYAKDQFSKVDANFNLETLPSSKVNSVLRIIENKLLTYINNEKESIR